MTTITDSSVTSTLLPLARYARIMQVNPIHFFGAIAPNLWPNSGCTNVWPEYTWQTNDEIVSRDYVASHIANAENDIKRVLGYSPAPFFEEETHSYFPASWTGLLQTKFRKLISVGHRTTTTISSNEAVVYTDIDSDGFSETATITVTIGTVDPKEVRLYFSGYTNKEIRPIRSITVANGVATIKVDSYLFIDPIRYDISPGLWEPIDLSDTSPLVSECDVIRVHANNILPSARLIWARGDCTNCNGAGCLVCSDQTQDACLSIVGSNMVKVTPAEYLNGSWVRINPLNHRVPDRVVIWYQAGDSTVNTLDLMPRHWAMAISYMASARLSLPVCDCTNVRNIFREVQRDLSKSEKGAFYMRNLLGDVFTNPFGTREGEYRAWQQIAQIPEYTSGGII